MNMRVFSAKLTFSGKNRKTFYVKKQDTGRIWNRARELLTLGLSRPAIAEAGRGRKRLGREAERCALALEGRQPRRVARPLGQNGGSQRGH